MTEIPAAALLTPLYDRAVGDARTALRSLVGALIRQELGSMDEKASEHQRAFAGAIAKSQAVAAMLGAYDLVREVDEYTSARADVPRGDEAPEELEAAQQQFREMDVDVWFDVPFAQAIDDLAGRYAVMKHTADWARIELGARNLFWVAQAATTQIAERVRAELTKAVTAGVDLDTFADRLRAVEPATRAWSNGYLKTVFRTNLATAYNRGRDKQAQAPELKGFIAGWEAITANDMDTRPNHLAAHGLIFGVDNPERHLLQYPRYFACRCMRRMVTVPEAARRGILEQLRAGKIIGRGGRVYDSIPANALPTAEELVFMGRGAA